MRVFITGGSGLVGTALTDALLRRGDVPIVLSRDAQRATERLGPDVLVVEGDPTQFGEWTARIDGCDAVVNLAGEPIFGNLAGTAVIFGSAIGLILRERLELDRIVQQCLDQGFTCWPDPSAFTRYAIYAFIALFEVMALFLVSLKIEEKVRRRGYAPEWR